MEHDTKIILVKLAGVWSAVGVSQMTPLQWVQLIAAAAAGVYSIVQTYYLIKHRGKKNE